MKGKKKVEKKKMSTVNTKKCKLKNVKQRGICLQQNTQKMQQRKHAEIIKKKIKKETQNKPQIQ